MTRRPAVAFYGPSAFEGTARRSTESGERYAVAVRLADQAFVGLTGVPSGIILVRRTRA